MKQLKQILSKSYQKKICGGIIGVTVIAVGIGTGIAIDRSKIQEIKVDGIVVGYTKSEEIANEIFETTKQEINKENGNQIRWAVDLTLEKGKGKKVTKEEELKASMEKALDQLKEEQEQLSYTIKIDDYEVTLKTKQEVEEVLEKTQEKYSHSENVAIELVADKEKNKNSLVPQVNVITKSEKQQDMVMASKATSKSTKAKTAAEKTKSTSDDTKTEDSKVVKVAFEEEIEVKKVYVKKDELTTVNQAVQEITKEKEKNETYQVQSGDTISSIANGNGMTVKEFMEINDQIEDQDKIMPGDEVIIEVPKPELSVIVQKEETHEETYKAKTVYVDNASMYEGETKVVNKGKAGVLKVTTLVNYKNGDAYKTKVTDKEVVKKAVPTTIERGTKVRPTFIKPISGGTLTSSYGQRWGRTHEGVDWACSVGTSVKASSEGTVTQAGWMNGYGYCVTISHANGMSTRYGHMSKVAVSVGQTVSQGDIIGYSGNTGRSTGPHLHFEIRKNGVAMNPFDYL